MRTTIPILLVVALSSCFSEVETDELAPIDGYRDWLSVTTHAPVPAHSRDGMRITFANDVALGWSGFDEYPIGSVFVKEIYNQAGTEVRYLAIMRRLDRAPNGGSLDGKNDGQGWLFTRADSLDDAEIQGVTCWGNCHVQAPFAGTWLDYQEIWSQQSEE